MRLKIKAAVHSHVGKVRRNNEDNFYLAGHVREDLSEHETAFQWSGKAERFLCAVADGMGGEARGEAASLAVVQALHPCGLEQLPEGALSSVREANDKICTEIIQGSGRKMGSTLVALYIDQGQAACCNIGDSRLYRLHDGSLTQLFVDHNRAWSMVEMGLLTREQAACHPGRRELTQHLGIFEDEFVIEPAFCEGIILEEGDCFLLCSDGLTDAVTEEQLTQVLGESVRPEKQAFQLVQAALEGGGPDNITALVVQIHSGRSVLLNHRRRRK